MNWPNAWTLLDGAFCQEGSGSLDGWGNGPHHLEVSWPCVSRPNLFLALTLVFDVEGYGRLEFADGQSLTLGCPPHTYAVRPVGGFGEAGAGCDYTNERCVQFWWECVPSFSQTRLDLSAPVGGVALGELSFEAWQYFDQECGGFVVHSSEPWAKGYIVHSEQQFIWDLKVEADATGLDPGSYQAKMQVELPGYAGRCIQVDFQVLPSAGVVSPPSPNSGMKPFELRLLGANPSPGPFVFAYMDPRPVAIRGEVFDAEGRAVATLADNAGAGGQHILRWNAEDAGGRPVAPGIYLVRLSSPGRVQARRAVVVR
jgi:hypothetical protein